MIRYFLKYFLDSDSRLTAGASLDFKMKWRILVSIQSFDLISLINKAAECVGYLLVIKKLVIKKPPTCSFITVFCGSIHAITCASANYCIKWTIAQNKLHKDVYYSLLWSSGEIFTIPTCLQTVLMER